MTTTLPADPDTQRLAEKLAAESGASVETVLREAIEGYAERRKKLAKLRKRLAEGAGDPCGFTIDEIEAHLAAHGDVLASTP